MNGDAQNTPTPTPVPQENGQVPSVQQAPVYASPAPSVAPTSTPVPTPMPQGVPVPPPAPQDTIPQPDMYQQQTGGQPFVQQAPTPYALPPEESYNRAPDITWTASEFVAHHKTPTWYLLFGGGAIVAAGLVGLITRDVVAVIVIVLMSAIIIYGAGRQPRTLNYALDDHGLYAGQKMYPYELFKSFSIVREGPLSSIILIPVKRLQLPTSVYYDPKDEPEIVDILGAYLPKTEYEHDPIERLARKLHF